MIPPHARALQLLDDLEEVLGTMEYRVPHRAEPYTLADIFRTYTAHARASVEAWYQHTWRRENPYDNLCVHGIRLCLECDPFMSTMEALANGRSPGLVPRDARDPRSLDSP